MIKITSKDQRQDKHLRKLLSTGTTATSTRSFAVEGLRALEGIKNILELYVRRRRQPAATSNARRPTFVSMGAFESAASTENSQGVIAVAGLNILDASAIDKDSKYLLLDRLQDPGNMGTIIRSACAFGFKGVINNARHRRPVLSQVTRAASGALWKIDVIKTADVESLKDFT